MLPLDIGRRGRAGAGVRGPIHWLREAAEEGYLPAMLDYARACQDPGEEAYWLR
ncbi:MAG: hypothetical protein ACYC6Y_18820 [Thermoguttaceae bacterium]